ncbi:histidine phosphatase family protein [Kineococcus rhizosphaerae]|uniref:Broad specificity phosphatase PhoE n=1 Tax=Kineococcus rhizosphaerae TaxID=559628 RepID=A0A2T0R104_9ACTN|nr:histidine phosphatase family protein [Kineococcus rhizosphaerae]PRY12976.1 broad specificity phosphatase PhoE [Kineococcus rhizosphaerae]
MNDSRWPSDLVLVRHGQSTGNLADAHARSTHAEVVDVAERDADVPLSALGVAQAQAVARWLAQDPQAPPVPEVVVASPYLRARDTAEAIVRGLHEQGVDLPLRTDERLRERDLGWWDGLTGRGVRARFPEEAERRRRIGKFYYRPPGGESWCDVALRVRSVLSTLREDHPGQRVLVVSHQAVIMNFRLVLEDLDEPTLLRLDAEEPLANCSVTAYRGDGGRPVLDRAGDVSAVRDVRVTDDPVDDEPRGAVAR